MSLNAYIAQVQSLLDDPGAVEYTVTSLQGFINEARVQVAIASEAIRFIGELLLIPGQNAYAFETFTNMTVGTAGPIALRKGSVVAADGSASEIYDREWEWFWSFCLNGPVSGQTGTPDTYSVLRPGIGGAVYLSPVPGSAPQTRWDCVGYPLPLNEEGDPEALPYPWTESVQYLAAYLALLNAQRYADADSMLQRYDLFQTRATQMTTPTTLPGQYPGQGGAQIAGSARPIATLAGSQAGGR